MVTKITHTNGIIYSSLDFVLLISSLEMADTGFYDEDEDVNMLDGKKNSKAKNKANHKTIDERLIYAAPFHTQVAVLLRRTWRTIWREKVYLTIFYFFVLFIFLIIKKDNLVNSDCRHHWR